jgi:beta-lactamase regulating signal transducer with metallopeptidase domain/beta-lactamase class D
MNTLLSFSGVWQSFFVPAAAKGAALLLLALGIGLAMRRSSAEWRCALWLAASVSLAALSMAVLILPAWRVLPRAFIKQAQQSVKSVATPYHTYPPLAEFPAIFGGKALPVTATEAVAKPAAIPEDAAIGALEIAALMWFIGAIALIARLFFSALRLQRLERQCLGLPVPERLATALYRLSDGMRRRPRILIGPESGMPMVWGLWKPRLLLPAAAEGWADDKLEAVLLHELAHIRRSDPAALLLAYGVQALHWCNPLSWIVMRRLRADQERACDDAVLQYGIRASDYARLLLEFVAHSRLGNGVGLCALTMARTTSVDDRMLALLDPATKRQPLARRSLLFWLLTATALALPLAMLAKSGAATRGPITDRNGLVLAESRPDGLRAYPMKALAAHLLGHTGVAKQPGAVTEGRSGMELRADETLAAGGKVELTIDARMQSIVEHAMINAGVGRGAAVVLDPRNGDVLALASLPNFNPGKWTPQISEADLSRYSKNQADPMTNRAVKSYAPGSTFKLLTALAGARAGITDSTFECTGSVSYGEKTLRCWLRKGHGTLNMEQALEKSCNCFFYQFGNKVGIETFEAVSALAGLGGSYQLLMEEDGGVIPTREWMAAHSTANSQSPSLLAYLSIGQGYVMTTPLQMATLAATVANGGKTPEPRLMLTDAPVKWRGDMLKEGITVAQLDSIRKGMWEVVNNPEGTGTKAQIEGCKVAGKTGTAQYWRTENGTQVSENQAWFIGFAPYDHPRYAFAILVQGGSSGGSVCAPIAARILEQALALKQDGLPKVQPMDEQSGHLKSVTKVVFADGAK